MCIRDRYRSEVAEIPSVGWLVMIISAIVHVGYSLALGAAYKTGDLSVVYPVSRSAPIFVLIIAVIFLGERVTAPGVLGILIVVAGVMIMGWKGVKKDQLPDFRSLITSRSYLLAILVALIVALYSIFDKIGVRYVDPFVFLYLMLIPRFVMFFPYVMKVKRDKVMLEIKENPLLIVAVGILRLLGYFLVLVAMRMSPVSYIISARQISIVGGVILGTLVLKESYGRIRLLASILIFLGIYIMTIFG